MKVYTEASFLLPRAGEITPMISMLRYMNDRRLPTLVTLLYCVRTREDIIFETELERLSDSCPNLDYCVCLSQPDESWNGQKGRLSQRLIIDRVIDLRTPTFFLCGPSGFMEHAYLILRSLDVEESRITQESFGGYISFGKQSTVCMSTDAGLVSEQKDAGYVLPCVGRPEGAVVVAA
jgi:ferredoxin-NADP reductase